MVTFKHWNKNLLKCENLQKVILDNIPHIAWLKDKDSRYVAANEAFAIECGVKAEDIVGKTDLDLWPLELAEKYRADDKEVMESGRRMCFEEPISNKEGRIKWFEMIKSLVYNEKGEITGIVGIASDIGEHKQVKEKMQAYQEKLRLLAIELSVTQEKERRHIAEEIHDFLGQTLSLCKLKLEQLRKSVSSENHSETICGVLEHMNKVIQYSRTLTIELSPLILYEVGLKATLEWLTEHFSKEYNIVCTFHDDGKGDKFLKSMSEQTRIILFHAVREVLVNIVKHAQASNASVTLQRESNVLKIIIEDDGVGYDPSMVGNECFGIFSTRERLATLNGALCIDRKTDKGTVVSLVLPCKRDRESNPTEQK